MLTKTQVPAGRETGIFYLILAGLAFGLKWQDLMDHAMKNQLDIEYATVYPRLGGWLRCLDRQTFLRAFEVFSHAEIKGKPVLADSRNDQFPVMLMSPPPPLRQSLPGHHFIQNAPAPPSPPQLSFPENTFGTLLPGHSNMPALLAPLSPVDTSRQLHLGVPIVHLVPVYVAEHPVNPHSYSCVQPQSLGESSVDWQDGYGGYGVPTSTTSEGGVVFNHTRSLIRKAPAKIKQRAMTLEAPPDRRASRTPVVVNGSRSSHGHGSRNSC